SAEIETLEVDFTEYRGLKVFPLALAVLQDKLEKSENSVRVIGSVNMRALEVYDEIKKEYDSVAEKVETLTKEKEEIMKIIEEIDKKKRRSFLKTLTSINDLFTRNFTQLSTKGEAFLNLENKEDPFAGGLNILIKIGKGKYFDVTSLSGGEKTLVALSLIFAIQEYKPYSFYIFDEVDAALDKRNSERLASLVKKYMKTGQYIIITHNDIIITESNVLYGISMQDGISKILSLEV
ncbi:MAG: AAA family ATPase, partial [archaeon]